MAEEKKALGNDAYLNKNYKDALKLYSDAISKHMQALIVHLGHQVLTLTVTLPGRLIGVLG
jgi:hypothetical protein